MSDIFTLTDAVQVIRTIGDLTYTAEKAAEIVQEINTAFANLHLKVAFSTPKKCLYLIWRKPYMAVATGTFIDDMLQKAGFSTVLVEKTRYPIIDSVEIARLQPEIIFLSSEPFPFSQKHIAELQEICPNAKIQLVDGEVFSWYGSRLRYAPAYFSKL